MVKCKDFFMLLFLHKFYKSHFEFIKGISCELFITRKKVQPNKRLKKQLSQRFLMHIIMLLGIQINKKRSTFMCHVNGRHLLVGFTSDMSYNNIWRQRRVHDIIYGGLYIYFAFHHAWQVIFLFGLLFNLKTFLKFTWFIVVICNMHGTCITHRQIHCNNVNTTVRWRGKNSK